MVHGLNATRLEPLRAVAAVHGVGLPVLDITYRNDVGAPRSPDGLAHLGADEWRDLEAAVEVARTMGARYVVLYGWSMGAEVIARFLAHSPASRLVTGVVLDSPVSSVPATVRFQAAAGGIGSAVAWGALQVIGLRTGAWFDEPDEPGQRATVAPPTLIIEGTADTVVPVGVATPPVAASIGRGADPWFVEFPAAGHTRSWNTDPGRYDALVSGFLRHHLT
jgi:hypothetical protein